MARSQKKRPLYEVISQSKSKLSYRETMEKPHPDKVGKAQPGGRRTGRLLTWSKGPRIIQFVAGRVEISIPYQLAVAFVLGLILLVLVAFRLGQNYGGGRKVVPAGQQTEKRQARNGAVMETREQHLSPVKTETPRQAGEAKSLTGNLETTGTYTSKPSNRIVIQTYAVRAHLEPVRQYFAENGIETEIRKIGDDYFLVTTDKFDTIERTGTDGYKAKKRIIELGAKYKAPQSYETFGKRPFHDAYGMKFDD